MTPDAQNQFLDDYLLIENPQERFSAIVSRNSPLASLDEAKRTDANQVEGCVSRVWLVGELDEAGKCRFRAEADAAIVDALAKLIAEWFDGMAPKEIMAAPADLLDRLGIASQLSPTRRRGMGQIFGKIRGLAESWVSRRTD